MYPHLSILQNDSLHLLDTPEKRELVDRENAKGKR